MKKIKIVELPEEELEKAKIIGNVFDKLRENKDMFEKMICELLVILKDKYNFTTENWNEDIAPILRKHYPNIDFK